MQALNQHQTICPILLLLTGVLFPKQSLLLLKQISIVVIFDNVEVSHYCRMPWHQSRLYIPLNSMICHISCLYFWGCAWVLRIRTLPMILINVITLNFVWSLQYLETVPNHISSESMVYVSSYISTLTPNRVAHHCSLANQLSHNK